ncbi:hypothetical protein ONE63_008045 [Megalurothrips usitatus]|uniref:Uncharacterized protein n=1 Tax=Megalurothrips usitatus TaxID=439358 RepID=A0AAV7XSX4_9NEOP|nr:hypothetical protein ONE63_008045 [Megalurothrips usitatus]
MEESELSDDFVQATKKVKPLNNITATDTEEELKSDEEQKSEVSSHFSCQYCKIKFTFKTNCTRHERSCSANSGKQSARFPCPHCQAPFTRRHHLNTHLKKCSSLAPKQHQSKRQTPCLVKNCEAKFYFKTELIEHLSSAHKDDITIKPKIPKTFKSMAEFLEWKEKEEESTFSFFTARKGQSESTAKHYYCQHDGSGKVHSMRKSSRKNSKGRIRVGHYCMAKMKVSVDVDNVEFVHVVYYPTHSHKCKKEDMLHHPLPAAMSKFIDEKLAENIPPTIVYELVKERFLPKNTPNVQDYRANILTKKRVLIYKPYGGKVVYGPEDIDELPDSHDLFMFAFQTDRQLDLMRKHGSKILIVDETHGTNHYKYQLLTVMVVDENRRGWPVAHLITSKSDGNTLKFFFQTLKSCCDDVPLNCVITDDDPALINAMEAGFSERLRHLLCKWHVIKNLKENLRSKVPHDLVEIMLSEMKVILNAESESLFLKLKDGFINKYKSNPDASKYMSYLNSYYWPRAQKWAMFFRNFPHAEVNTTGHIESFHSRLKRVHLKRKVNKRLDDLINILYDVEWQDYCTRLQEASIGFSVQPQLILDRHKRGLLMEDDMIIEQTLDRLWEVKSATGKKETYIVERYKVSCNFDHCFSKCLKPECHGLCAHLFSCSCPDHHPLCKHIHKVQSFLTRGDPFCPVDEEEFYNFETLKRNEELDLNIEFETLDVEESKSSDERKRKIIVERLQSNVSLLQQFINAAQGNCVPEHSLIHVDAVLSDLVRGLEPVKPQQQADVLSVLSMQPAVSYAPNEKLKTQMSQLASFRRPQKRKKKDETSVLAAKKKAAIENLLNCASNEDANDNPDSDDDCDNYDLHTTPLPQTYFTLPSSYVTDPFDFVLRCGVVEISLIHLKSLELHLLDGEEEMLKKRDPIFRCGWLYDTIINAFMSRLSEKYENVFTLSSDHVNLAQRGISNVDYLSSYKEILQNKEMVLCPVNFTDHWCILLICIKEKEIRYYNPLQAPLGKTVVSVLTQMVRDLRTVFPSPIPWKIKVIQRPKKTDSLSCGPLICQYAIETVDASTVFHSVYEVRKFIYDFIVGKCLKRSTHFSEQCGSCGVELSSDCDVNSWICCSSCDQWFHTSCTANITKGPFVCQ